MDLPIDVQHRILEKLPLKTLFQIRYLHSTFNNYFRFHCKTWRCSYLVIYRPYDQTPTCFQLDGWVITPPQLAKLRHLEVELLRITTPDQQPIPIDLGELGILAETGRLRARIVQVWSRKMDEGTREFIRNIRPKVLHICGVFSPAGNWLSIPPSCEKVTITAYYNSSIDLTEATGLKEISINQKKAEKLTAILDKIREGVATRQMVYGMIDELNSGEPGSLWTYRGTDDRHYIRHTHVTFFITKLPTASQ